MRHINRITESQNNIKMEENDLKTKVVGVDISIERTTYAMVDVRGNILAEDAFSTLDYPDVNNFVTTLS